MSFDLRLVVAGIFTITMFVMLIHMIKRDHVDYVQCKPHLWSERQEHYASPNADALASTEFSKPDSLNLHSTFDSKSTQLLDYSPIISIHNYVLVASCDDILCFSFNQRLAVLYNPCIRKLQKLPYIDLPPIKFSTTDYAFGYDPFIDNYKVVAIFLDEYAFYKRTSETPQVEVHSYTLGTDSWKRIKDFPSMYYSSGFIGTSKSEHGIFMRGTVNWLTSYVSNEELDVIVSLHLGKESYQEISLPDFENSKILTLDVMRDCLCVFEISKQRTTDVCLMKEYGNKESWIKLIRLPRFGFRYTYGILTDIVYISED